MKEIKFKYFKNSIRLCLFKVALLLSVFSFSGFNAQLQSTNYHATQVELVESRTSKPIGKINKLENQFYYISVALSSFISKPFNIWALRNHNHLFEVDLKINQKKTLLYQIFPIKTLFKIPSPSSEDEILAFH
jgi:hypothetical protein